MSLVGRNAARRYGLSERDENLARFLGEIIAGSPLTPDEAGEFRAMAESMEYSRAVGNAQAVLLAGADTRRKQLIISAINSASAIYVGGSDQVTVGQGLPVPATGERALGDYPGAVWAIAAVAGPLDIRVRVER